MNTFYLLVYYSIDEVYGACKVAKIEKKNTMISSFVVAPAVVLVVCAHGFIVLFIQLSSD